MIKTVLVLEINLVDMNQKAPFKFSDSAREQFESVNLGPLRGLKLDKQMIKNLRFEDLEEQINWELNSRQSYLDSKSPKALNAVCKKIKNLASQLAKELRELKEPMKSEIVSMIANGSDIRQGYRRIHKLKRDLTEIQSALSQRNDVVGRRRGEWTILVLVIARWLRNRDIAPSKRIVSDILQLVFDTLSSEHDTSGKFDFKSTITAMDHAWPLVKADAESVEDCSDT